MIIVCIQVIEIDFSSDGEHLRIGFGVNAPSCFRVIAPLTERDSKDKNRPELLKRRLLHLR